MENKIFDSKPDTGTLSEVESASYDLLDSLGISYTGMTHAAANTVDDCAAVEAALGVDICKNLFLTNARKSDFYMLVMPGHKVFKTKELSGQIGSSRLSFAGPEYMMEMLHVQPGSVSILALANDKEKRVRLLIDRELLQSEYFGCHPCKSTASLKIKTADIMEKLLPAIGFTPTLVEL